MTVVKLCGLSRIYIQCSHEFGDQVVTFCDDLLL
jgi:hypothetical protein